MKGITKIKKITEHYNLSERDLLQYALGGLMYTPAHNPKASELLINKKYSHLHAMTFCLEDAIADGTEDAAIAQLTKTFSELDQAVTNGIIRKSSLPYLFVRVKYPEQMLRVYSMIGKYGLLKGFIFPKFDVTNASEYLGSLEKVNLQSDSVIFGMPILESYQIADISSRMSALTSLKSILDDSRQSILNIRIGGNDFSSRYGIRRNVTDTIYDVKVIADIISDIVNVFSVDYVVSAPVWEYFGQQGSKSTGWAEGLRREAEKDILNGLIGKTAIHPTQLPVIDEVLAVTCDDYNDAINILNWNDNLLAVAKSHAGNRMNEQKVHGRWAKKILIRSAIYGIKNEEISDIKIHRSDIASVDTALRKEQSNCLK